MATEKVDELNKETENVGEPAVEVAPEKPAVHKKDLGMTTILSAALGLFGAGDFYLGNIKRGIVKVIGNVVVPLVLIICLFAVALPSYNNYKTSNFAYTVLSTNKLVEEQEVFKETTYKIITVRDVTGSGSATNGYAFTINDFANEDENIYRELSDRNDSVKSAYEVYSNAEATDLEAATKTLKTAMTGVVNAANKIVTYRPYFEYIVNKVDIDKTVDEKYDYKARLKDVCEYLEDAETECALLNVDVESATDLDAVYTLMEENVPSLIEKYEKAHDGVCSLYDDMGSIHTLRLALPVLIWVLMILLIADLIVVAIYWVHEVFVNREKCKKLNEQAAE